MAEKWELGGTVIEQDGEKLVMLNGIRMVDKKPVRATVYHKLSELERFLYDFIKRVDEGMVDEVEDEKPDQFSQPTLIIPQPQQPFSVQDPFLYQVLPSEEVIFPQQPSQQQPELSEEESLKQRVSVALSFLLTRKLFGNELLDGSQKAAVSVIIASSFGYDISIQQYDSVFVPTFSRKEIERSENSVSLPTDVLQNEIFSRLTSLRSSTMMKMVGKAVGPKKYKYENLVDIIPEQALVVLSKLYEAETDPGHKEYLFSLMLKAWSVHPSQLNLHRPRNVDSTDLLTTIFSFAVQVSLSNHRGVFVSSLLSNKLKSISLFIDLGLLEIRDLPIANYRSGMISIPDDYFTLVEQWSNDLEKHSIYGFPGLPMMGPFGMAGFVGFPAPADDSSPKDRITLYKDLKNGRFSRFYDCRFMADAVRKGYIRKVWSATELEEYYVFLESLPLSTQEEKELVRKFIEPNPFTDFFLAGVKPTIESIVDIAGSHVGNEFIIECILHGMDFIDQEEAAKKLVSLEESEDAEEKIIVDLKNVFILKELGNDKLLVFIKESLLDPVIVRKFGHLHVRMITGFRRALIEYFGNATDEQLGAIISLCRENGLDIEIEGYVDDSITDLELYKRYKINTQAIEKGVYEEEDE